MDSSAAEYAASLGDPDLYKLFSRRYRDLLRSGGTLGVVLPRNAFAAKGSAGFREWLLGHAPPLRIDFLRNRRRGRSTYMLSSSSRYSAERATASPDAAFEVAGVAESVSEFAEQTQRQGLVLRRPALGRYLEFPLLRTQDEADLLAKLREGSPFALGAGRWRCFPVGEFHETNDKHLLGERDRRAPFMEGRELL